MIIVKSQMKILSNMKFYYECYLDPIMHYSLPLQSLWDPDTDIVYGSVAC